MSQHPPHNPPPVIVDARLAPMQPIGDHQAYLAMRLRSAHRWRDGLRVAAVLLVVAAMGLAALEFDAHQRAVALAEMRGQAAPAISWWPSMAAFFAALTCGIVGQLLALEVAVRESLIDDRRRH